MIRAQRLVHPWLWLVVAVAAVAILTLAIQHRPDYPVDDPAASEDR